MFEGFLSNLYFLKMAKKKNSWKYIFIGIIVITILGLTLILTNSTKNDQAITFRVRKNWNLDSLDLQVEKQLGLTLPFGFSSWCKLLGYNKVKPCVLYLESNVSAFSLIKKLRKNRKQTIDLVILPGISREKFVDFVTAKLDITPREMHQGLMDVAMLSKFGVNDTTWHQLIIPNTYNISVNVDFFEFLAKMQIESTKFWNSNRLEKLKKQKLSIIQAITVASIVNKESNKEKEYENIAGVYLNRFRMGKKLEADPTVNFAKGVDERVTDTKIESPYNTYIHNGLPPGPICIPSVRAIDAVLNYDKHDYIYFCAKSDFSGYHIFEKDYSKHLINGRQFRKALDREEKIRDSRK